MALDKFINCTNDLLEFEIEYTHSAAENNIHSLEVLRVELDSLWSQVKRTYEKYRNTQEDPKEKPIDKNKLRDRPTFYGDFVTWPTFCDLFNALYTNNSKLEEMLGI